MTDGNIEVSEVVIMRDGVDSWDPVYSCHCQFGFSELSQQPHRRTQPKKGRISRRGGTEQKGRWDIRSRFSYETLSLLDDAFGKRHISSCV